MISGNPSRDVTPAFLARVKEWLESSGEMLVILRFLCMAGGKDYTICRSFEDFLKMVDIVPNGTEIILFKDRQLPIRGRVDDAFIVHAQKELPQSAEYLIVILEPVRDDFFLPTGAMGEGHDELLEHLEQLRGREVALGRCPPFWVGDHEGLVSASKGGIDGPR